MRQPNYDKFPQVNVPGQADACVAGWRDIGARLAGISLPEDGIVVVETYPGVTDAELLPPLQKIFTPTRTVLAANALVGPERLSALVDRDLTTDRVFARMSLLNLEDIMDLSQRVKPGTGVTLVYGTGASLLVDRTDLLIYAEMARWEIQLRQRRNIAGNIGLPVTKGTPAEKYKRAYFLDWRLADRLKRRVWQRIDFVLDTNVANEPKLVAGEAVREGLRLASQRPFRVVPFFDPGPWGGQWMKEVCDLDRSASNFAWCFDCVPEENSLLLGFGRHRVEVPSIDLVFQEPVALLGQSVYRRFGAEFPIRFDFLDTMGGGNLSLQVHPLTDYMQQNFGMAYTQDESYYLLDVSEGRGEAGASVYLGFKEGVDRAEFISVLKDAQVTGSTPDIDRFVNRFPAKKHDHFLIPAGTIHCSGAGAMVLEISATPYIFTFKLYDWGRMGMDGRPRPIHLEHGENNLKFDRTTEWVRSRLMGIADPVSSGDGWREEKTGLHELEFIETRRHWFTQPVEHHTHGGVNVLNLVQGEEATVESPSGAFAPFVVHYAETFIVPAAVGKYRIRPSGIAAGKECATLKAFVRTNA